MDPRIIDITVPMGRLLRPVTLSGALIQGEAGAHRFVVAAVASPTDPTPVPLTGTVTARFVCPNGVTLALTGEIQLGRAVVDLTGPCYELSGRFALSIFCSTGGVTLCSCAVSGDVRASTTDEVLSGATSLPDYTQVLAVYDDMQTATAQAETAATNAIAGVYAAEAVAKAYDGAVIPPCDDSALDWALITQKAGMVLCLDGATSSTNNRLNLYGTAAKYGSNPTYGNVPTWYGDPLTDFVVGHTYAFDVVQLGGAITETGTDTLYYTLRTAPESGTGYKDNAIVDAGGTWVCTFVPEMICFSIRNRTFDHAILWLKITDLTAAASIDPLKGSVDALSTHTDTEVARLDALIDTAEARLDTIDNRLDAYGLPAYWQTYIAQRAAALNQVEDMPIGASARFAFVTDVHLRTSAGDKLNQGYSPTLIEYLHENANLGLVVFGGDAITGNYATKADAIADLSHFRRTFAPCWDYTHALIGNHEYGGNSNSGRWAQVEDDRRWVYNLIIRDKQHLVAETDASYGSRVLDDKANGIRYLLMNESMGGNYTGEFAWVCEKLNEVPAGWAVVILSHRSIAPNSQAAPTIDAKVTAAKSLLPVAMAYNARETYSGVSFAGALGKVICIIGGHCHFDASIQTTDTGGIPVISVTCDRNLDGPGVEYTGRETGTTNEQAFDVFDVIKGSGTYTINAHRIGAGADRTWTVSV